VVNELPMSSAAIFWQSCPHSILLTLPPLATIILKGQPQPMEVVELPIELEESK
jgi:hypothetical protein